jgi:hypothetical protein
MQSERDTPPTRAPGSPDRQVFRQSKYGFSICNEEKNALGKFQKM